jgi:DNA-binding GntR family transcriptional regulator
MSELRLERASTVDQLAAALRERILDGELEPGRRLIERELVEAYDVARHTLRAALRQLQAEGLVRVEPNRGARVAALSPDDLGELFALRLALEARPRTSWNELSRGHEAVHRGLVCAARAPRIERAYAALSTELALFLGQLRPVWTRERLGPDHLALLRDLETEGPDVLRAHMAQALRALAPRDGPA